MASEPIINNISSWLNENSKFFVPPVCNKLMHNSQLKVFYVGGPNVRKDFHLEEGEEFFYMKKGDMCLPILTQGKFQDIHIREGEIFLLPGKIPHSPQRQKDTIGLVIERLRQPDEMDCLRYYVEGTANSLFERWFYCENLGTQLAPIIREFMESEQNKTGKPISGTIPENPPYKPDSSRIIEQPFSLKTWLEKNKNELQHGGSKRIWGENYETEVIAYGPGTHEGKAGEVETYVWIVEGDAKVTINEKETMLSGEHSILINPHSSYSLNVGPNCVCLTITMDPKNKKSAGNLP